MAKKPVARRPAAALPAPFDDLITALTRAGVQSANNDGGAALRQQLAAMPYAFAYYYPCPRFAYTDPDPLVPAAPFDVYFHADWTNTTYNVSVTDMTTGESFGPFSRIVAFGEVNPVAITVPAQAVPFHPPGAVAATDIVVANHDYTIFVYATFSGSPFGCIARAFTTLSNDDLKQAIFRALTAQGQLPFGAIPPELQAANVPKAAKRAKGAKKK